MSAKATVSTGKFSLTRKIASLLKLGDDGKLDSFFERVVKQLKKEATLLTKNLETLAFNHKQELDDIADSWEDAKEALEDAYGQVDVERIKTNESQKEYLDSYLLGISRAKESVVALEAKRSRLVDSYESRVKELKAEISSLEKSASKIGSTK